MLIEDDQTMMTLLETLLSLEGFWVVSSGNELFTNLLPKIMEESPDIILLDVNLNRGSGVDLLGAIRSNSTLNHIRVIMSSGIDYQEECLKKGAQGFILKPYMPDELITMINQNETKNVNYG